MTKSAGRVAPLSSAQRGLWLLDRLYPGEPLYNEVQSVRLIGRLDPIALEAAFAASVRRHEALRTVFRLDAGAPTQVVLPDGGLLFETVDLRALPAGTRDSAALTRARAAARRPFDLATGPLLRATLLRLDDSEHWLVVVIHHIVTDGWSTGVLWAEVGAGYASRRDGWPLELPPLPMQYADWASAEQQRLSGPAFDESLAWWTRELHALPALELPLDRARPALTDRRGGSVPIAIDAAVGRRLKDLARAERATPYMALLAVFQTLLHRITGQVDFGIGVAVAGRCPEVEALIGLFVNMLVLRADVAGAPGFVELLGRVRRRALDGYAHDDVPFERIVAASATARDPARNPLFQASFGLLPAPPASAPLPGLVVEPIDSVDNGSAKFDLALTLFESGDAFVGRFEFPAALFDADTIAGWAAAFRTLCRSIVDDPARAVDRLPLVDARGRGAGTSRPDGARHDARVEALFERIAADRPHAVALIDDEGTLTYGELDARASVLAHRLRDSGLGPSRRVGTCLDRGRAFVVAALAVLKARGAYVPLDPEHPAARLRTVIDAAAIDLVVTDRAHEARVPSGPRRLLVDGDRMVVMPPGDGSPVATAAIAEDEGVACVYTTSGTTGRPRAARIAHTSIVGLCRDTDYVRIGPGDRVAALAGPAFDATTFEVFGALLNGATIVPFAKEIAIAPRALAAGIRRYGITTLFVTTALFNEIARECPDAYAGCRDVLFGGEVVEPRWVRAVLDAGPPRRLIHVYGPTEATTFTTWHEVTRADVDSGTIPIGRSVAGAVVEVVDAHGEPVPPGIPGEIRIGGAGVARGYVGDPSLSADRFVPDHGAAAAGALLYRTGDRARLRGDGEIVFVGRADRQVKIRGQRIELDEIETALARLPGVRSAVVALRGATSDSRRIVAWLVASDPDAPPPPNIRREARLRLPEAMLPAAIVWIGAVPLTRNGKVDVHALPEPGETVRPGGAASVPPRDMFERVIARIWEELLGVRGVGVHDRFFEIGGHSLLAARLVDAIERATGLALPLTALYAGDTIDAIARGLRDNAPDAGAPVVAIRADGARPPFVFLHGDFQAGGFYSRALAQALPEDQPTLIVHPHGLAGDAVPDTIEAMARDRIAALRERYPNGPYLIGGHCNGALVAYEMARQLAAQGVAVPAVVLIESRAPAPGFIPAPEADGETYVKFDAAGRPTLLQPRDRLSDVELRYNRAIDAYAPGRYDGHVVVIQAEEWRHPSPDAGWAHYAPDCEGHVLPGGHVTLITDHLPLLADTIRDAIDRAWHHSAARPHRPPETVPGTG